MKKSTMRRVCADEAFDSYNNTALASRAAFLERIADGLDAVAPQLAQRTSLETGLPVAQLEGEAAKAATQFRQFPAVVRQGRFRQAAVAPAQPERQPRPRIDQLTPSIGKQDHRGLAHDYDLGTRQFGQRPESAMALRRARAAL
ncbi:aldehyde dehydrogenase family protein [Burkholderia contaminans]|uniref:aldehyde dehydrogenase family protein n=1 Tax=Burkholderia contaminans TaxID=488447 RepID=UPI001CF41048|nr:aldehyde dehydrogenase family protein [Burkholderia contaminans]MCA8101834.1 aldehyde dehydrogenase family protein [Burkholderia contaminans]